MKDPNIDSEGSSSLDKEEHPSNEEGVESSTESGPGFEEQKGELLPPEEKKKAGSGKVFLLLILILAGSGGYLYFNNLIPAEILNIVSPKSVTSQPPALVTQTPSFMEENVAEILGPVEDPDTTDPAPAPPETEEAHISEVPLTSPTHLSGADLQAPEEEAQEDANLEEVEGPGTTDPAPAPPETEEAHISEAPLTSPTHLSGADLQAPEEEAQEDANLEEAKLVIEQEGEAKAETITPPVPAVPESAQPEEPRRSKAVQAYLDFIESSVLKIGELIKERFDWGRDYLKEKPG